MAKLSFNGHAADCRCIACEKSWKKYHKEAKEYHSKPWAVGFDGHARSCDCKTCTPQRMRAFKSYYEASSRPPLMPDQDRTVFVRAHWRKQKNHLNRFPLFKKALIKAFL